MIPRDVITRIRAIVTQGWRRVRGSGSAPEEDTSAATGEPASTDGAVETETFSGERVSKADVAVETGLAPAEYLLHCIEERGGRLQQQEIVDGTGWSEATVSRTLRSMEDDGCVVRIQLGRANLVCLPDAVPEVDADSRAGSDTD